jgi:iron transport multicopper oxidase
LQRPSLAQIGSVVYGAFGGHCDLFNYTGLVIGVDVNQKKIVTSFATETGPWFPRPMCGIRMAVAAKVVFG